VWLIDASSSLIPSIKGSHCFFEQETLPFISTGWFKEQIQAW